MLDRRLAASNHMQLLQNASCKAFAKSESATKPTAAGLQTRIKKLQKPVTLFFCH